MTELRTRRNEIIPYSKERSFNLTAILIILLIVTIIMTGFRIITTIKLYNRIDNDTPEVITIPKDDPKPIETPVPLTITKDDLPLNDSYTTGATKYSEVFQSGANTTDVHGNTHDYAVCFNSHRLVVQVDNNYSYLKGSFDLSMSENHRHYVDAQILVYDAGSTTPFYISDTYDGEIRETLNVVIPVKGHSTIIIEFPFVNGSTLSTDGLYFSNSR